MPSLRFLRLIFGVLGLVAVGRQFILHVSLGFSIVNFFAYFTNLANLFAACVLLAGTLDLPDRRPRPPGRQARARDVLRAMAALDMSVVGLVFAVLLSGADLGSLLPWVNFVVHYLMPVIVLVDWVAAPPRSSLGLRELGLCVLPAIAYLTITLIRGRLIGWYPYPFLNPAQVDGYGGVAAYAAGVAVTFMVCGAALLVLGNARRHAQPAAPPR